MKPQPDVSAFIYEELPSPIIMPHVSTFGCRYDRAYYSDDKFDSHGVHFFEKMKACAPKRRAEFLAGRYCAKRVLEEVEIVDQIIDSDKNRCPLWPEQVKGSISHNDDTAMAAITVNPAVLGIGIDVETIIPEQIARELEKQIVYGDEYKMLTLSSAPFPTLFSLIFSIKESFFKAAYSSTGHYFGFEVVKVTDIDFTKYQFQLELVQDLNPHLKKGSQHVGQFSFIDNSVISLLAVSNC